MNPSIIYRHDANSRGLPRVTPVPVIVAGMHRSGTSLVASILAAAGRRHGRTAARRRPQQPRAATSRTWTSCPCSGGCSRSPRLRTTAGTATGGGPRASGWTAGAVRRLHREAQALVAAQRRRGAALGLEGPAHHARPRLLGRASGGCPLRARLPLSLGRRRLDAAAGSRGLPPASRLRAPHLGLLQPPSPGFPPPPPGALPAGQHQRPAPRARAAARPPRGAARARRLAGARRARSRGLPSCSSRRRRTTR